MNSKILRSIIKYTFVALCLVFAGFVVANAQDRTQAEVIVTPAATPTRSRVRSLDTPSDRFKIGAALTESTDTIFINPLTGITNLRGPKGLTIEGAGRIHRAGALWIGAVANFNRANIDRNGQDPVDRYSFGPRFQVDVLNGHLAPFGHALVGFRTSYNQTLDQNNQLVSDRVFSRTYGFGLDVRPGGKKSNFYIRAFGMNIVRESDVINAAGGTANQKRFEFGGGFQF